MLAWLHQWSDVLALLLIVGAFWLSMYLHDRPAINFDEDDPHKRYPGEGYGRRFGDE